MTDVNLDISSSTVKVTLLLFASYRQSVGKREMTLELPEGLNVREVAARLEADHPGLTLKGALCAVNEAYVSPDYIVSSGDTVAFFPPVSGGSGENEGAGTDHFFVTEGVLDVAHFTALAVAPEWGAVASFLGTVRSPNLGQNVRYIDYEGYETMILGQMKRAAEELRARFELGRIVLAHRLGRLEPGEASILIVISSKHRRAALDACSSCIDRLKELLPVWKYEVAGESEGWVQGSAAAAETL